MSLVSPSLVWPSSRTAERRPRLPILVCSYLTGAVPVTGRRSSRRLRARCRRPFAFLFGFRLVQTEQARPDVTSGLRRRLLCQGLFFKILARPGNAPIGCSATLSCAVTYGDSSFVPETWLQVGVYREPA